MPSVHEVYETFLSLVGLRVEDVSRDDIDGVFSLGIRTSSDRNMSFSGRGIECDSWGFLLRKVISDVEMVKDGDKTIILIHDHYVASGPFRITFNNTSEVISLKTTKADGPRMFSTHDPDIRSIADALIGRRVTDIDSIEEGEDDYRVEVETTGNNDNQDIERFIIQGYRSSGWWEVWVRRCTLFNTEDPVQDVVIPTQRFNEKEHGGWTVVEAVAASRKPVAEFVIYMSTKKDYRGLLKISSPQ